MTPKNPLNIDVTPKPRAKSGNRPPPTERRYLRSDESPTEPLPSGTTWLHTPLPPPAPNKPSGQLTAPSDDEGSPILLSDPDDVIFQEIAASGRQRVTPLRDAILPTTENPPPATGNSFAALMDTDNNPTLADDDDDILFRAICVSLPEVAAVLVQQDNIIRALPEQVEPRMGPSMEE